MQLSEKLIGSREDYYIIQEASKEESSTSPCPGLDLHDVWLPHSPHDKHSPHDFMGGPSALHKNDRIGTYSYSMYQPKNLNREVEGSHMDSQRWGQQLTCLIGLITRPS